MVYPKPLPYNPIDRFIVFSFLFNILPVFIEKGSVGGEIALNLPFLILL